MNHGQAIYRPPRAILSSPLSLCTTQSTPCTPSSSPGAPELEIELEPHRFGSPEFARYMPSPLLLCPDLQPPPPTYHFPSLPRLDCNRSRPERPPPEAPPPQDLVAGEPGHPGDRNHLHLNGDSALSPMVPSSHPAVPYFAAGEHAGPLVARSEMTGGPRLSSSPLSRPLSLSLAAGPRPSGLKI